MEEDDEIQSPASGGSGSLESPGQNGRITVTVAVPSAQIPAPAQQPQTKTLTLALPSQGQQGKSSGGGREDCWSEGATAVLIDAWGERYMELSRGNLKQKHWKDVADIVSGREDYGKTPKTDIQCKNRIDTVKKKYKLEKSKISAGGGPSKWPFFGKLDHLIGPGSAKVGPGSAGGGGGGGSGSGGFSGQNPKVPMGMPVGGRPGQFFGQRGMKREQREVKIRPRGLVDWDSDESGDLSPFSIDHEVFERKRRRTSGGRGEANVNVTVGMAKGGGSVGREKGGWGSSMKELTQAILKFGEAYEHAEIAKLQQVMELEKQRMKFARELELQRMQFFTKTQVEISLKHGRGKRNGVGVGVGNASNHHRNNNHNNNSDCSN